MSQKGRLVCSGCFANVREEADFLGSEPDSERKQLSPRSQAGTAKAKTRSTNTASIGTQSADVYECDLLKRGALGIGKSDLLRLDSLTGLPKMRVGGIYAWFFCSPPKSIKVKGCQRIKMGWFPLRKSWYLLYVGKSENNLYQRVHDQHYLGKEVIRGHSVSNLRMTLASKLEIPITLHPYKRLDDISDRKLTHWMAKHARVVLLPRSQPSLDEKALLNCLKLPLNTHRV